MAPVGVAPRLPTALMPCSTQPLDRCHQSTGQVGTADIWKQHSKNCRPTSILRAPCRAGVLSMTVLCMLSLWIRSAQTDCTQV